MKRTSIVFSIVCLCVLTLGGACSRERPAPETRVDSPPPVPSTPVDGPVASGLAELVPYGREPWPGIITGGQPSKEDFESLHEGGIRTVINLRVATERGTRDEPDWIEELGLDYVSIPVDGAPGLSEEVARQLDRALQSAERPVLVHCGSSNRVGAAFALRAFHIEGKSAEEALRVGRSAGLTKLEGKLRKLLWRARTSGTLGEETQGVET